jgi:hypothetical protein
VRHFLGTHASCPDRVSQFEKKLNSKNEMKSNFGVSAIKPSVNQERESPGLETRDSEMVKKFSAPGLGTERLPDHLRNDASRLSQDEMREKRGPFKGLGYFKVPDHLRDDASRLKPEEMNKKRRLAHLIAGKNDGTGKGGSKKVKYTTGWLGNGK